MAGGGAGLNDAGVRAEKIEIVVDPETAVGAWAEEGQAIIAFVIDAACPLAA